MLEIVNDEGKMILFKFQVYYKLDYIVRSTLWLLEQRSSLPEKKHYEYLKPSPLSPEAQFSCKTLTACNNVKMSLGPKFGPGR